MPSNPETSGDHESIRRHPVFQTPTLPDLGPETRDGVLSQPDLARALEGFFAANTLGSEAMDLLRSLALIWHDHLEESHQISQNIDSPDGSLLHGIMHRREPDYSNAKYWFRRAGQHPVYGEIAKRVSHLLAVENCRGWKDELIPNQVWDPMAFVDACQRAAASPGNQADAGLLKKVQATELETVWDHFAGRQASS